MSKRGDEGRSEESRGEEKGQGRGNVWIRKKWWKKRQEKNRIIERVRNGAKS